MRFPQVSERVKEAPANALRSVFASIGQVLLVTDRMKKKSGESEAASAGAPTPATASTADGATTAAAGEGTTAATGGPTATATKGSAPAATVPAPAKPADVTAAAPTPEATAPAEAGEVAAGGAAEAAGASAAPTEAPAEKPAARKPAAKKPAAKAPAAEKPAARTPAAKRGTATGNVRVLPDDEAKTTPVTARKPRLRKPPTAGTTAPAPAPAAAAATPDVVAAPEGPAGPDAAPLPNYDALTVASLRARLRNLSIDQVRALIGYEQAHANRAEVIAMFERRVAKLEAPES
jgi:hypothetical protein